MTGLAPQVPDQGVRPGRVPSRQGDVSIRLATTESESRAAVGVLAEIWPQPDGHLPLTPEMAWALAHAGNYLAVARRGDEVVGATLAFYGSDAEGPLLHSHMTGLKPAYQGSSIGFALKQHQRSWAIDRGVDRVVWTFDPLVARNAYFNVMKLGAVVTRYYRDFYGPLTDGINAGDESDRCLVSWRLNAGRAVAAAAGQPPAIDLDALRGDGATVVLDQGSDGRAVAGEPHGSTLLCRVPADMVTLRRTDPDRARSWRLSLRQVLEPALAAGYELTAVSRDGWYVLTA